MNGNHNVFVTLGASNHTEDVRHAEDYYATEPKAVKLLLEVEKFNPKVLECCCGEGHISKELENAGYEVESIDLYDRGYGTVKDFFTVKEWNGDVVSNPPYKQALPFVKHALDIIPNGYKVAFFLRLQFLGGKERGEFYKENPPKYVYVARGRLSCAKNGEFEKYPSNAIAYAWFIWEKGFKGEPVIRWIN